MRLSYLLFPLFFNFTLFILVELDINPKTGVNIFLPSSSSNKTSYVAGLFSFFIIIIKHNNVEYLYNFCYFLNNLLIRSLYSTYFLFLWYISVK